MDRLWSEWMIQEITRCGERNVRALLRRIAGAAGAAHSACRKVVAGGRFELCSTYSIRLPGVPASIGAAGSDTLQRVETIRAEGG